MSAADSKQRLTDVADTEQLLRLISVPTGLGKTAAIALAWLWNRPNKVASASVEDTIQHGLSSS